MARELRWWIGAPFLACVAVGVAYLPPRSAPVLGQTFFQPLEPPAPYRLRTQALAQQWRATALELHLIEARERLRPEVNRRRALETPGPAVLFEGSDTLSDTGRRLVRALLDSAWSQLGLRLSKVSVGVLLNVEFGVPRGNPGTISDRPTAPAYLLPDTSDRTTCIALLPLTYWGRPGVLREARPAPSPALEAWLRNGLGPCAFYAAFGVPGRPIARWLGARRFDLAIDAWGTDDSSNSRRRLDGTEPWFWMAVYRYPAAAVGCIAGRENACRAAVLAGNAGDSVPRLVTTQRLWWEPASPAGADRYLADAVRDAGRERFGRFWNSELPADTALAAALRLPVGEWTRRWQATIVPPIRLGPAASPGAILFALLLGLMAVLLVAFTVSRREVR